MSASPMPLRHRPQQISGARRISSFVTHLSPRVDRNDEAEVARHIGVEQCIQRGRDVDSEAFLAQHLGEKRGDRFGLMPLPATPEYERAPATSIVPQLLEGLGYT